MRTSSRAEVLQEDTRAPHMETVQFRCDVSAAGAPLYHSWEHTVGGGHAPMALRSAWQAQLRQCHDERDFGHVRFHGWLSDEMGTLIRHHDALLYSFFNADQILDSLIAIAPLSHPSSSHVQSHEPEAVYDFAIRDSMLETPPLHPTLKEASHMTRKQHHGKTRNSDRSEALERSHDVSAAPVAEQDLHAEIGERAYAGYLARGAGDGHDLDDWLEAERDVRDRPR